MKVIFDLDPKRTEKINRLVESKKYGGVYNFIGHAIDTLLEIEHGDLFSEVPGGTSREKEGKEKPKFYTGKSKATLPELLRLSKVKIDTFPPNDPEQLWPKGEKERQWMWGQINSVLAIKFCVRALANVLHRRSSSFVGLDLFTGEIRSIYQQTRHYLINLDELYGRERDARYSRSFPSNEEKSWIRFESQYIGITRKKGWSEGAISLLGFVQLSPEDLNLRLTKSGLDFALAKNPVFDEDIGTPSKDSLSDAEIRIYLKNVREFSVAERYSLTTVASLIADGNDTPASLNQALGRVSSHWTEKEIITYRAGAVARLCDLKILGKEKGAKDLEDHRNVRYIIDSEKASFLGQEIHA